MPEILINKADDPNRELESMGVSQDLSFGGDNTLLKKDKLTYRPDILAKEMKCFKFRIGDNWKTGFILAGEKLKTDLPGFAWISHEEYFILSIGKTAYFEKKNKFRTLKRFEHLQNLEAVRGAKVIEDKLIKRN